MTVDRAERREVIVTPETRRSLRASVEQLWAFREVVQAFASRGVRVRYKQTYLGVAWAVLQPLAFLVIFVIFFSDKVSSGHTSAYAAATLAALVPWQFIATSISFGANALVTDADLLRKVYFPREAPVLGAVGSCLPDLGIGLLLLVVVLPFLDATLSWNIVWVPLLCVATVLVPIAASLPLGAMNVYYRDFRYVVPFLVQFWLLASPVAYPASEVSAEWRWLYAIVNPAVGPLEGFRRAVALGVGPDWTLLGLSMLSATAAILVGYRWFKVLEREFADVV
jgi:lipopolysaccharide transport system permease protein